MIPFDAISDVQLFFEMLEEGKEEHSQLRARIHDWGLSHPTLEEVFLKLTRKFDDRAD